MSIIYEPLALNAAVLSNGARLAVASGGLPDRITTKEDIRIVNASPAGWNGPCFSQNGQYIYCGKYGLGINTVNRYRVSDGGAVDSILLAAYPSGEFRAHGRNEMFVVSQTAGNNHIQEIDSNAFTLTRDVLTPVGRFHVCQVPGVTDKIWQIPYPNGTLTEYSWPGMVATGRSIAGVQRAGTSNVGGTPYIWATLSATGNIAQYNATTLALVRTYTRISGVPASRLGSGSMTLVAFDIHPISGLLYAEDTYINTQPGFGNIDIWDASGAAIQRFMWAGEGLGGSIRGLGYELPIFQFSDDGVYFAQLVPNVAASACTDILIRSTRQDQRARWTRYFNPATFPAALTIKSIDLAGCFGNVNFGSTQWGITDFKKVLAYWSVDGGVTRTAFTPSTTINILVYPGQTLTVDVDMCSIGGKLPGPDPYVEYVKLVYDDPSSQVVSPYKTTDVRAEIETVQSLNVTVKAVY